MKYGIGLLNAFGGSVASGPAALVEINGVINSAKYKNYFIRILAALAEYGIRVEMGSPHVQTELMKQSGTIITNIDILY